MIRQGTYNKQFIIIVKDKIKQFLFIISFQKYQKRKRLKQAKSIEEKWNICNEVLGVHQNKFEIISFVKLLEREQFMPEVLIEIGTANGGNNLFLASCLPSVQLVIGIDLYVKNTTQIHFYLKGKRVNCINGSSYDPLIIEKVKKIIRGYNKCLIFIDGDHRYEGVKADYQGYKQLLGDETCFAFHDIVPDSFLRYGEISNLWVGEVPLFWNELKALEKNAKEIIEDAEQNGLGIGVLLPHYTKG